MFRPKLAVWLSIAFVAAWLASCSSDVDRYHLVTADSPETGTGASGAGSGGASGSGAQMLGPNGGGAGTGGGTGSGGGTGGRQLDSGPDGDGSLASGGGAPTGGAGGGNTGGTQSGGTGGTGGANTGGAVTGGAGNGGTGGTATGGGPNTGGAPVTGGAPNTGGAPVTGGAPNTGGAPTGGRSNTGGAPTGGAPTGGAPTGGTPNTGGAPTGGTPNTGGSPTGGTAGTGGAGGYPGDPTQVTLTGPNASSVTPITAAAWVPSAGKFYLLKPSTRQYFVLATDGTVTGPTDLQGTGTVAASVFGANATDVFFASGSPSTLFRQSISTGTATQVQLIGSPALGTLTGAHAGTWFLIGNSSGAYQALADGSSTITTSANLDQIHVVTTDASSFAFRAFGSANKVFVHRITPGSFSLNATPCDTLASGAQTLDAPVGLIGSSVAWVFKRPFAAPLQLNVATLINGSCGAPLQVDFGDTSSTAQTVGLISDTDALVTPSVTVPMVTIEMKRAGSTTFSRTLVTANMGSTSAFPIAFVGAVEPTPHFAVLVTKFTPILISF